jgi:capsular polysaccharide biosynthesis protein
MMAEFRYECHTAGTSEVRELPTKFVPPAFVAQITNGMSFGRHCCAIGPSRKAIRETGFNLDSTVLIERKPISPLRLQYWRKRWEGDVTSRPWLPPKQHVSGRVAVLNTRFSHNFYHWMIDILPRIAPLARLGIKADFYLIDCLSPFQQTVLSSLGIEPHQLVQPHSRLLVEADELIVPSLPTPACIRELGVILAEAMGVVYHEQERRIYISRRRTGTRTIDNEDELEILLATLGFETHYMETYPLATQAQLLADAKIVVAPHGAGLANLLFARKGASVVEIVPAGRYNATCYPEKSRIFSLHHQLIFASPGTGHRMTVDLSDVKRALTNAAHITFQKAVA